MSEVHRPRPTLGEIIDSLPLPTFAAPGTPVAPKKELCADSRCVQFADGGSKFCCNCEPVGAPLPAAPAPTAEQSICHDTRFMDALDGYMDAVTNEPRNTDRRVKQRLEIFAAADAWRATPAPTEQAAQKMSDSQKINQLADRLGREPSIKEVEYCLALDKGVVPDAKANIEAAAKAIYRLFDGADEHPWVEGGNSTKQDDARRYARAALAANLIAWDKCVDLAMAADWQQRAIKAEAALAARQAPTEAPKERDNCQMCLGAKGGVKGNENVVSGVVMCDHCSALARQAPDSRDAARYRFLRDEASGRHLRFMPYGEPEKIDAVIDAAIAQEPAQ